MAELVAGEIEPVAGRAHVAAQALQRLGFRVLHIGPTISVDGPARLWSDTFEVSFEPGQAPIPESAPQHNVTCEHAGAVRIPPQLEGLVQDVAFVRPPEFF